MLPGAMLEHPDDVAPVVDARGLRSRAAERPQVGHPPVAVEEGVDRRIVRRYDEYPTTSP